MDSKKMKNKLFKTCLTGLALSIAGLANAEVAGEPVTIFTPQLISHAVISGGALNIAADSVVDGHLAAQAAVTIGAGLNTQAQNIYAGAAVTTGALSTAKHIFSGAAASIGASAHAQNVHAGAAITIGAGGEVHNVHAGAAITLGVGATTYEDPLAANANTDSPDAEDIHNATSMAAAIAQIGVAQVALSTLNDTSAPLYTTMGGFVTLVPGVHQGEAVNIAANSLVTFSADETQGEATDHVWVINLSEALTVGAGTVFETDVPEGHTATIIWNVGAAVTLGAGTKFIGTAFVGGAFNAATSDVSCGNIYATGVVSVGSIGALADDLTPLVCDTNARSAGPLVIDDGGYTFTPETPQMSCSVEAVVTLVDQLEADPLKYRIEFVSYGLEGSDDQILWELYDVANIAYIKGRLYQDQGPSANYWWQPGDSIEHRRELQAEDFGSCLKLMTNALEF
jgi:hypothetical protein